MTNSEAFVETLVSRGVTDTFGIVVRGLDIVADTDAVLTPFPTSRAQLLWTRSIYSLPLASASSPSNTSKTLLTWLMATHVSLDAMVSASLRTGQVRNPSRLPPIS